MLSQAASTGQMPHLLLYGPPGTGKTSAILALAHELFGEAFRERVLDLNASDERGIAMVRTRVKAFAQVAASNEVTVTDAEGHTRRVACPPFKLIILDEADSMTDAAQSALRRLMEAHSRVTRFCILCNYVSRIIDPVASRCAKLRFLPLEMSVALAKLREICEKENVPVANGALEAVHALCGGDMRRMITLMQSLAALHGGQPVTVELVREVAGFVPEDRVRQLLLDAPSSVDHAMKLASAILLDGYSAQQVLLQLAELNRAPIQSRSDADRARLALAIADADRALVDGADELLQLCNVCQRMGPQAYAPHLYT